MTLDTTAAVTVARKRKADVNMGLLRERRQGSYSPAKWVQLLTWPRISSRRVWSFTSF